MTLSQIQIIQSLGEAMNWLEKELTWGVAPAELRHLTGRIGELYVATICNRQMALDTNQKGYDVVSKTGERISVKTTTMANGNGHISFNVNTLQYVDRVIVLFLNTKELEIEILRNVGKNDAVALMSDEKDGKRNIALSKLVAQKTNVSVTELSKVNEAAYKDYKLVELESGTIEIYKDNIKCDVVKPVLTNGAS